MMYITIKEHKGDPACNLGVYLSDDSEDLQQKIVGYTLTPELAGWVSTAIAVAYDQIGYPYKTIGSGLTS